MRSSSSRRSPRASGSDVRGLSEPESRRRQWSPGVPVDDHSDLTTDGEVGGGQLWAAGVAKLEICREVDATLRCPARSQVNVDEHAAGIELPDDTVDAADVHRYVPRGEGRTLSAIYAHVVTDHDPSRRHPRFPPFVDDPGEAYFHLTTSYLDDRPAG